MKSLLTIIAFFLFTSEVVFAVQNARKPFVKISFNGIELKDGDIIDVEKGDLLKLTLSFEGGRRDFVKFPDSYANISREAQILSRNENRLVYLLNGEKHEWKLINQDFKALSDDRIKIRQEKIHSNSYNLFVNIPGKKIEEPMINLSVLANWQYTEGSLVMEEEDKASAIIHLRIKGKSDEWFASPNIRAGGTENVQLDQKLDEIQNSYNTIEAKLIARDFSLAQQEIRKLQNKVRETGALIQQLKNENPAFLADITFIGLPSDKPVKDISAMREISNLWTEFIPLLKLQQNEFSKLPSEPSNESKTDILRIAQAFDNWFHTFPKNGIEILSTYIPETNWEEKASIHHYLSFNPEHDKLNNVGRSYTELNEFITQRSADIPAEVRLINNASNRLQAVRLLDGMLRGFISAINFASWDNSPELLSNQQE